MDARFNVRKALLLVTSIVLGVLTSTAVVQASCPHLPLGPITSGGSASDDFGLAPSLFAPGVNIGAIIERDRMYMAERPGFLTKRLPISFDAQGNAFSGGRYLFETYDEAKAFGQWLSTDFILDGVNILDRPEFLNLTAFSYRMIGGWRWEPVEQQVAMRVERWSTAGSPMPPIAIRLFLLSQLPLIEFEAERRGYSEVWLAYSAPDNLVAITTFTHRIDPTWDGTTPDFASLGFLASAASMDTVAIKYMPGWVKAFDRTSWVFNTWFHFYPGDHGPPSVWPNSPPFPEPFAGDALCIPSRGETSVTAPSDCLATCGNSVADAGETTANCPGDVRLEPFLVPDPPICLP